MKSLAPSYLMKSISALILLLVFTGCEKSGSDAQVQAVEAAGGSALRDALTLYASFDAGFEADFARGDKQLYVVDISNGLDATPKPASDEQQWVKHLAEGGKYGGALRFSSDWNPIIFYRGDKNIAYQQQNWSGAFSFWLRVNAEQDLAEGYSDPFIVTDKNWDDASLYVDFTEDQPRHFRFAGFPNKSLWNPDGLEWENYPASDRPMVDIADHPFNSSEWIHVVLVFEALNNADSKGVIKGYLNGEFAGEYQREAFQLTWNVENVMVALGRHYQGDFDELSIFSRAITPEEVKLLNQSPLIDLL